MPRILIVEDDELTAKLIEADLEQMEHKVVAKVPNGEEAVTTADETKPDLVLMDILLEGEMDGIETADQIRSRFNIPVVYLTGHGEKDVLDKAKLTEPYGYLVKPVSASEMRGTIETALYKHQMEKQLRESEERFRQVAANAQEWIWEVDADGLYTYSSPTVRRILGYAPQEIVGEEHFYDLFHPDDREEMKQQAFEVFARKEPFRELMNRNVDKDGKPVWLSTSGVPVVDKQGNLRGYRGTDADITERKKAEEALRQAHDELDKKVEERTSQLGERIKELNCLYGISELVETPDISFDEIIQGTVELIPASWQYPEVTCARIFLEGLQFKTENFGEPLSEQSADIVVHGEISGSVVVRYLEQRPESDEGPFLTEERSLINAIAERVGRIIDRKKAQEALRKAHDDLELRVKERTSELARANELLRESEERLRSTWETLHDFIFVLNKDGVFEDYHQPPDLSKLYVPPEEFLGRHFKEVLPDDVADLLEEAVESARHTGLVRQFDYSMLTAGEQEWFNAKVSMRRSLSGGFAGVTIVSRDITDRKKAEDQIKASLKEKEVLLREIHHRVKNNLQVISTLLSLQSRRIKDDAYHSMFTDAQDRIKSMALAHEKLYQAKDLAQVNVSEYVSSLGDHLFVSYSDVGSSITLKKEMADVSLALDLAVPIGFVISELVSNSLKHAFPEGRAGKVTIALRSIGEDELELIVSDNGVGIREEVDPHNPETLGLDLVNTFVAQLEGEVEFCGGEGTEVRVRFKTSEEER